MTPNAKARLSDTLHRIAQLWSLPFQYHALASPNAFCREKGSTTIETPVAKHSAA
jgi:hypothetical protein